MNKLIKKAFTLIELLVVIAIIGILSGLIVVSMGGMTQKATMAKVQVFSNSLRNSLMINLVSEWKFDGPSAIDGITATTSYTQDTWGNNTGTIGGSPKVYFGNNCVSGSCLQFSGSTDYLNCGSGSNLNFTNGVTMAAWVKLNALPASDYTIIVNKGGGGVAGYRMRMYISGAFYAEIGNFSYTYDGGSTKLKANTWYHIVSTYSNINGALTTYLDGVSKSASVPYTGQLVTTGDPFCIGGAGGAGMNGFMDDVRIFNAAVSTSQIYEQYYSGLNKLLSNGGITKEEYLSKINRIALAN